MTTPTRATSPEYRRVENRGDEVNEPTTNARQGVTHQNVRYVLAISTIGVAVLFAIIYLFFFAG